MKPKRPERVERRRGLLEMNLLGEQPRARPGRRRRWGCLPVALLLLQLGILPLLLEGLRLA